MNDATADDRGPVTPGSPASEVESEGVGFPPGAQGDFQEPEIAVTAGTSGDPSKPEDPVDTEEDEGSDQETPPEEDFPSATFNQDKQVADTIYNVGIMMGASEKPLFERIPATVIDQVGKLFLPPPH